MTVEGAILYRLQNHAGLVALIADRAWAMRLPQSPTLPAVVFQRISTAREHAMGSDPGIVRARFQFTSWSDDHDEVKDVSDQVVAAMSRWRDTQDGTQVDDTMVENELDGFEAGLEDVGLYRSIVDAFVYYRE